MYASLLKSLDSALHGSTPMRQQQTDNESGKRRMWLKEASTSRLTEKILNTTELTVLSSSSITRNMVDGDKLEESGLLEMEKQIILSWVTGQVSGRHCMCMLAAAQISSAETVFVVSPDTLHTLLATIVSFPSSVMNRRSNIMFDRLFRKPPIVALRDILKSLSKIAREKSFKTLRVEQINLAFKQIRLQQTKNSKQSTKQAPGVVVDEFMNDENSNSSFNSNNRERDEKVAVGSGDEEVRCLHVMMELVKLYFLGRFHSSLSSPFSPSVLSVDTAALAEITKELATPKEKAIEEAVDMTHLQLDKINQPIKQYITQLSRMKQTLSSQLKSIEESGAYLSLGVTKEMSDADIKKAYHSLAVKIHPDKPGGDTKKFQELQTSYQDIVGSRKTEAKLIFRSEQLEGAERAREIDNEISSLLNSCNAAAQQVAALAQIVLQVLKMAEKCSSKFSFPRCAPALYTLLLGETEDDTGCPISVLLNTVEPTERVAEALQQMATKSIELSACGSHYAVATAVNRDFNSSVEGCMKSGLEVLRSVTSMLSIETHASECLDKMKSSRQVVLEDVEAHDIIVDMMLTVVRSCAVSLKGTADKVLAAAVAAADLQACMTKVIAVAQDEASAEAKKDAEFAERKAEAEFQGDLDGFLEANAYRAGAGEAGSKSNSTEAEQKKEEEAEANTVEALKEKSMTADISKMQQKMHAEVMRIQLLPSFIVATSSSSSSSPSGGNGLKEEGSMHCPRVQIFALLADLLEHSLVGLRGECLKGQMNSRECWEVAIDDAFKWMTQLQVAKLALWPDLRTRALWLAALIDQQEVASIIETELAGRLRECLLLPSMQYSHYGGGLEGSTCPVVKEEYIEGIHSFCLSVTCGVALVMESIVSSSCLQATDEERKEQTSGKETNEWASNNCEFNGIDEQD